jgi:hypothetical protein
MNDKPRRVPEEDDDSEGSTEPHAKLVAPDASSKKEVARLEHERIALLEQQLSQTLAAQIERDRRIAQLTDQLAQKSALLERAEVNVVEAKKRAGLEQRELQEKPDKSQLPHDQAEANAVEAIKRSRLEQRELQAKLGELLLSRDQAEANAKEERKRAGLELRELQAKLDESLLSRDQAEANAVEAKKHARLEQRELQMKLDESLLSRDQLANQAKANAAEEKKRAGLELQSRDHALEQARNALQKASCAAEANEQSQRELTEMRAELDASKSELAGFRLRLADTENSCSKSKAEPDTYRTPTATGLVNTDEDRVMHRLVERMQAMEAEIAFLRRNEKSFERMECRNEDSE